MPGDCGAVAGLSVSISPAAGAGRGGFPLQSLTRGVPFNELMGSACGGRGDLSIGIGRGWWPGHVFSLWGADAFITLSGGCKKDKKTFEKGLRWGKFVLYLPPHSGKELGVRSGLKNLAGKGLEGVAKGVYLCLPSFFGKGIKKSSKF